MTIVDRNNIETQYDLEGLPRHLTLASGTSLTYQMRVSDTLLIVTSTGTAGQAIVTLPSLAEAVGKFYFITAPVAGGDDDVSLYEKETGAEYANGDMSDDDDHILLFSDGSKWRTILDGVT